MQNLEEDCSLWYVVHSLLSQGHVAMSQVKKIFDWELGNQPEKSHALCCWNRWCFHTFGHSREGPTKTAWPWLVALGCFPWLVYQASKAMFRTAVLHRLQQIWCLSLSSRRNPVSVVEELGCSRSAISRTCPIVQGTSLWVTCSY